jgi:hypothetical protein
MSSRLTRLCFTCESAAPAKQAKTVDVIDYNAVMKATKHHDPYVQAMEQLHCITKDLTVSRHSIKASSHGPRAANAAQEDLPQPNQVQQTPLSNTQLHYPLRQLNQLQNALNIWHVRLNTHFLEA